MLFICVYIYIYIYIYIEFFIVYQSGDVKKSTPGVMPLICLPNMHTTDTAYRWVVHDSTLDPATRCAGPILYTRQPGVYHCTVTNGCDIAILEPISVEINFGMSLNSCTLLHVIGCSPQFIYAWFSPLCSGTCTSATSLTTRSLPLESATKSHQRKHAATSVKGIIYPNGIVYSSSPCMGFNCILQQLHLLHGMFTIDCVFNNNCVS